MSGSAKMMTLEITAVNSIFNVAGAAELIGPIWGSISGSLINALAVCTEMIEEAGGVARSVSPRAALIRISKVAGPLLGLAQNDYINVGVALALVGFSAAAVMSAPVSGPVALVLAGLGLLSDAFALGAAQRGLTISRREAANRAALQRRIAHRLQQEYEKEQSRRPTIDHPIAR